MTGKLKELLKFVRESMKEKFKRRRSISHCINIWFDFIGSFQFIFTQFVSIPPRCSLLYDAVKIVSGKNCWRTQFTIIMFFIFIITVLSNSEFQFSPYFKSLTFIVTNKLRLAYALLTIISIQWKTLQFANRRNTTRVLYSARRESIQYTGCLCTKRTVVRTWPSGRTFRACCNSVCGYKTDYWSI